MSVTAMIKGSHWLRNPVTDTYRPAKKIQKARVIMFHPSTPAYRILLRASATWEWQLSQQMLCIRLLEKEFQTGSGDNESDNNFSGRGVPKEVLDDNIQCY